MKYSTVFKNELAKNAAFRSVPVSLLLIPLDILANFKFSCPCSYYWNIALTVFVFIAPALLVFALTFLYLLKSEKLQGTEKVEGNNEEKAKRDGNAEERKNKRCEYILISFFPAVMWMILLVIDGDYIACALTKQKGWQTFDDKLKIKWCKPTELATKEAEVTELQDQTLSYITYSQFGGYLTLLIFSTLVMFTVAYIYNKDGKRKRKKQSEEEQSINGTER